jgi:choline dehydrogenase-like flavoprotein
MLLRNALFLLAATAPIFIYFLLLPPSLPLNVTDLSSSSPPPADSQTYDYIVVGGGTAGNIVASLLSDDPGSTVLLVEAGGMTLHNKASLASVPGLVSLNVASRKSDWNLKSAPQQATLHSSSAPGFANRSIPIPRGKVLGGSNELNFMLHVRGTPGDYDNWSRLLSDDPRWSGKRMSEYETAYESVIQPTTKTPDAANLYANEWVTASAQAGHATNPDYNRGPRVPGSFLFQTGVKNGVRSSTARGFTLPRLFSNASPNLTVHLNAPVHKVLVKKTASAQLTAHGIVYGPTRSEAYASRSIIICAGTYHSPHILLKSGIGPAAELEAAGITPVLDLPNVGRNMQEHPIVGMKYRFGPAEGVWWPKSLCLLSVFGNPYNVYDYIVNGSGPLSTSGVDFGSFFHSGAEWEKSDMPDLQIHGMPTATDADFIKDFLQFEPTFKDSLGTAKDYSPFWSQGAILAPTLLHANSRGSVTLSADGDHEQPVIAMESYSDEDDVRRMIKAIRITQDIMRQPAFAQHEPLLLTYELLEKELGKDTDEYWAEYIKLFGFFVYHPTGTCKMGMSAATSVVDADLRVHGVANLRVADASVMPEISSGNTNVPTGAIAFQVVDMLRKERNGRK